MTTLRQSLSLLLALAMLLTFTCFCNAAALHPASAEDTLPPCHRHNSHKTPSGHDCCICQSALVTAPDTAKVPDLKPDFSPALLPVPPLRLTVLVAAPLARRTSLTAIAPPPSTLLRLHCALVI